MKRIIGTLVYTIIVAIILPATLVVQAEEVDTFCNQIFRDVSYENIFCPYIEFLEHQEVVGHNPNFNPDALITREQFAKVIINGFSIPINTGGTEFPDVSKTNVFYKYIMTLKNNSIISGYTDGTFQPERPLTRGAAMKIIQNTGRIVSNELFLDSSKSSTSVFIDIT